MDQPISVDGKEFISAVRAAKKIGYASDYIGQLCRGKKIPGRLIGKTWYVNYPALLDYKKNRYLGKTRKMSAEEVRTAVLPNEQLLEEKKVEKIPEAIRSRSLKNIGIIYEKEEISRLPELIEKTAKSVPEIRRNGLLKIYAPLAISLVLVTGVFMAQPAWLSPEPIKSVSGRAALILTEYRYSETASVSSILGWLKSIFTKEKEFTKMVESTNAFGGNKNGIVVFPETEDRIGISSRIKSIFSDNVEVDFDEDGDTGVIIPTFKDEDSFENYAFVIVPVPVKSSQPQSSEKVQ